MKDIGLKGGISGNTDVADIDIGNIGYFGNTGIGSRDEARPSRKELRHRAI